MSRFSAVGLLVLVLVLLAIAGESEAKRPKNKTVIRACKCKLLPSGGFHCRKGKASMSGSIKSSTIKCFCREISQSTEMTEKQKKMLRKLCGLSSPL